MAGTNGNFNIVTTDRVRAKLARAIAETGTIPVITHIAFGDGGCDGNGDPNIDTRADRISRNPVEERIPLDYDAAMKIFRDKEDYELEWAIQYLEKR